MRISDQFILRQIAGEYIIIPTGQTTLKFNGMITVNEQGAFLWEALKEEIRQALEAENIETRWLWRPMHMQPVFANAPYYGGDCARNLFEHGLCLPSGSSLTDDDIHRVADAIKDFFNKKK